MVLALLYWYDSTTSPVSGIFDSSVVWIMLIVCFLTHLAIKHVQTLRLVMDDTFWKLFSVFIEGTKLNLWKFLPLFGCKHDAMRYLYWLLWRNLGPRSYWSNNVSQRHWKRRPQSSKTSYAVFERLAVATFTRCLWMHRHQKAAGLFAHAPRTVCKPPARAAQAQYLLPMRAQIRLNTSF